MMPTCQIWNQDCITGMAEHLQPASIDFVVCSPPFEDLFQYSNKEEDIGNNGNTVDIREGRFALNLRFWIEQLFRVLKPGHVAAIHIQQLLAYKNVHGFMGRRDFRGAMVDLFRAGGFDFSGEFVVAKDPQVMAQQLNLHCLQFKTGWGRDSRRLMPAPNDYVLLFTRPGNDPTPVLCLKHPENPDGWYTMKEWIRDACGTWHDILMTDILDRDSGRENKAEKHCCPLQLSLIARVVRLYTNPGDIVLDPFMGIGSTAHVCLGGDCRDGRIEVPRNVVGFELKESYHRASLDFTGRAMRSLAAANGAVDDGRPSLFDCLEDCEAEAVEAAP